MKGVKAGAVVLVVAVVAVGAWKGGPWAFQLIRGTPKIAYRTAPVVRGDLLATIGATGTAEPEEVIDVGRR